MCMQKGVYIENPFYKSVNSSKLLNFACSKLFIKDEFETDHEMFKKMSIFNYVLTMRFDFYFNLIIKYPHRINHMYRLLIHHI